MGGQRRGAKPPEWPPRLGIYLPREALDVVAPPSPISFLYHFPAPEHSPGEYDLHWDHGMKVLEWLLMTLLAVQM